MVSETAANPRTVDHKQHAAFFRQSGWMMIATISAGAFSFVMHLFNKKIPDSEYPIFVTLLMLTTCIPATPLQTVFAQQSAQALATNRTRQLSGMIRLVWLWTFIIWLVGAIALLVFQGAIVKGLKLPNATGLWVTLPVLLVSVWMPLFSGVLQGRQDFFWLGWATMLGGVGRVVGGGLIVLMFLPNATGLMFGALIGIGVSALIGLWRTRDLWTLSSEPFDVKGTLGQVLPLMLGFGAFQFMFTSDMLFAKSFFADEILKPYGEAGTLSRAVLWLVTPLATVMFPKLVHSHAKAQKSNLLSLVLLGTGVLGVCGAVGLSIVGPIVVKIVYKSGDVNAAISLIPWYATAMIPLGMANVLVNDLMARKQFKVVPVLIGTVIVYACAQLYMIHHFPSLKIILQTLGAFTTLFFLVCAWFTWVAKGSKSAPPAVV